METTFDDMDDFDTLPEVAQEFDGTPTNMLEAGAKWAGGKEYTTPASAKPESKVGVTHEACRKCRGTGKWHSYSGMSAGTCYACKGTGLGLSMSPNAIKNRASYQVKKQNGARVLAEKIAAFTDAHKDIMAWWANNQGFEFARSTQQGFMKYGSLTEGQMAAIRRSIDGAQERAAARRAEQESRAVLVGGQGFDRLVAAFQKAGAKIKHPCLQFGDIAFKPAPASGKNAGYIYVTAGKKYGSDYYGKISPEGKMIPMGGVSAEIVARVKAIGEDPEAQSILHGKKTGICACCGAELTNAESVERGIGPICWSNYFG